MPAPTKFSQSELEQYFDRIRLPRSSRLHNVSQLTIQDQLTYLALLIEHQLIFVPFENLALHYSWHRVIDVDIRHLFETIVVRRSGGYCMQLNSFFHVVLSSLGFDAYMVPARVYDPGRDSYGGLTHCLNIVTLSDSNPGDEAYTVDVGFGANGPHRPCIMQSELVQSHIQPAHMRLRQGQMPGSANKKAGKAWFYEQRRGEGAEWLPLYSFTDTEIFPADVRSMNWAPMLSPTSIFRKSLICVIFTADDQVTEGGQLRGIGSKSSTSSSDFDPLGEIDGVFILTGTNMKWRRNGITEMQVDLKSEEDRLEAIEEYLGISLGWAERDAISGTITAITPT